MAARRRLGGIGLALGLLVMGGGCAERASYAGRRAQLEREQEARMAALGQLEVRLLAVTAARRQWVELGNRHEQITEIACKNAGEHVAAMEKHVAWQEEKARRLRGKAAAEAKGEGAIQLSAVRRDIPTAGN